MKSSFNEDIEMRDAESDEEDEEEDVINALDPESGRSQVSFTVSPTYQRQPKNRATLKAKKSLTKKRAILCLR